MGGSRAREGNVGDNRNGRGGWRDEVRWEWGKELEAHVVQLNGSYYYVSRTTHNE